MTVRITLGTEQKLWDGRIEASSMDGATNQLMAHVKKAKDEQFDRMEVACTFKVGEVEKKVTAKLLLNYWGYFAVDLMEKGFIEYKIENVVKTKYQVKVVGNDFKDIAIFALDFHSKLKATQNLNHSKICVVEKGVEPNVKKKYLLSVVLVN